MSYYSDIASVSLFFSGLLHLVWKVLSVCIVIGVLCGGHAFFGGKVYASHIVYGGDGRRDGVPFSSTLEERPIPSLANLRWDLSAVKVALDTNHHYLMRAGKRGTVRLAGYTLPVAVLQEVNSLVRRGVQKKVFPADQFRFMQLKGTDNLGNVLFTGYCSPTIAVSHSQTEVYRYPLYRKPVQWAGEGPLPTRKQIQQGALEGYGLELAWARDYFDVYILQTQGSGFIAYPDGSRTFLGWGGRNGHRRKSPGKLLISLGEITRENISVAAMRKWFDANPSRVEAILGYDPAYLFFAEAPPKPSGASNEPLTPGVSIAIDTAQVPFGTLLLVEEPVTGADRKVIGYRLRLAVAQDRGASIKGPGRIDLYTGWTDRAVRKAGSLHQYGRAWVILPKDTKLDGS